MAEIAVCPRCGAELVEVDNPFRLEVRHRRGLKCSPPAPVESPDQPEGE